MKKFNEYKERVFKIRIVKAEPGAWYKDLVGTEIDTCGYNQYDKENEWRVNVNGEEKLVKHNHARFILKGGFSHWSTVLITRRGESDRVAVLTGESLLGGLQVDYIGGGSGIAHPQDIARVLTDGQCFDDSEEWQIAKFFDQWKKKEYIVCPHCKSTFEFYTFMDKKTLKCRACQDEDKGEKGIRLDQELFKGEAIQLTDEDIRKNNSDVLFNHFKDIFKCNTGNLDPNHKGWISPDAPESLMESGAEIKYHYDMLGEERVNELRELFKACYKNVLHLLRKRKEERELIK